MEADGMESDSWNAMNGETEDQDMDIPMSFNSRMIHYSFFAYADFWKPEAVDVEAGVRHVLQDLQSILEFRELSWGPVAYRQQGKELMTDSLVYALREGDGGTLPEYSLVIRGTNPLSIQSWLHQDLDVATLLPWKDLSPHASVSEDAKISAAAATSLAIHAHLEYEGQNLLDWLLGIVQAHGGNKIRLNVTGHSLGGCMSSVIALWLHDELAFRGLDGLVNFNICALAGPTAGNSPWVRYLEGRFPGSILCIDNRLDIAPLVWLESDMRTVLPTIYSPITLKPLEQGLLDQCIAAVAGKDYAKAGTVYKFEMNLFGNSFFKDYLLQAAFQHVVPYLMQTLLDSEVEVTWEVLKIMRGLFLNADARSLRPVGINVAETAKLFDNMASSIRIIDPLGE